MKQNGNKQSGAQGKKPMSPSRARWEKWKVDIVNHYIRGHSMQRVCEIMKEETGGHKFSISTVHKYITEAVDLWKRNATDLIANHKAIELEKINRIEIAAWEGWTRSLTAQIAVKTKKAPSKTAEIAENPQKPQIERVKIRKRGKKDAAAEAPAFDTLEVTDETKASAGDPRFFATMQWCVEYRCKLLGTEAPVKVETNSTINQNINQTTTLVRKVVFKTRETTTAPQTLPNPANN